MNSRQSDEATKGQGDNVTVILSFGRLVALSLCLSLALSDFAQAVSSNAGTKNGNFLNIPTDARGVALSDVSVSMARGVDSLRWNTAGLGYQETKEVSATYAAYYQDVTVSNVGAALPFEESGLAASVFYLAPGSLDGRDVFGNSTGDFTYYDMVGSLGYGRKMLTRAEGADVYLGAQIKLVQESINGQTFQNPAFDVGTIVSPIDDLNLGLNIRDLSSGSANFSRQVIGGASYTLFKAFTPGFAINYANDAPVRWSVAGEYRLHIADTQIVDTAIRAGYRNTDSMDDSQDSQIPALRGGNLAGLTMGAGMDYHAPIWPTLRFTIDYAMAPFGSLGINQVVTLKAKW